MQLRSPIDLISERRNFARCTNLGLLICITLLALAAPGQAAEDHTAESTLSPEALRNEAIYAERCASCHDAAVGRTPPRMALLFVPPTVIVRALTDGSMKPMAEGLPEEEIRRLAVHLSALPDRPPQPNPPLCASVPERPAWTAGKTDDRGWSSTSRDPANTRFQPTPGLPADDVPKLALSWALAIPGGASGSPVISAGRLFVSSGAGEILALDAARGCTLWTFAHHRIVRTLTLGSGAETGTRPLLVFADDIGQAYALDAESGKARWTTQIETHPLNRATAAPSIHDGRVFFPMSSIEDPLTHVPSHSCCTSRGSVTAIDATTGKILWKQYTVEKTPSQITAAVGGLPARFSPAGGSIYTPLTVDARRGVVYASTAEAYTDEDAKGAYSVIALDLKTGERRWEQQFLPPPEDRAEVCAALGETDCRNIFSMGTSVTIHAGAGTDGAGDLLIVGQKWGFVYALDPDRAGALVWKRRVARGGDMGGIMYGIADDGKALYVPVSDVYATAPERPGDLVSLDPLDGSVGWRSKQPDPVCSWGNDAGRVGAQSAAPSVIPGVVFASAWDGFVRAHSSRTGELVWQFDTGRSFEAINGKAQGGQISAYPIQVVEGRVYVTSGASSQAHPGNALLVFEVPR